MPSLPPLKWDNHCWAGSIILPAWKGFQSRLDAYGRQDSSTVSDGTIFLNVLTPKNEEVSPSPEQVAAYEYLLDQQDANIASITEAILAAYSDWQEQYGYEGEEKEEFMPDIECADDLRSLIGLSTIRIFNTSKEGCAYVGFEFGCTWDDEHGLGMMTHKNRVVEVGGADTAILEWIADKDAEKN